MSKVVAAIKGLVGAGEDSTELVQVSKDERETFEAFFGKKLHEVHKLGATSAAVSLARELLEAARVSGDQPGFLTLVLFAAWELGDSDPAGYSVAIEAMDLLKTRVPERKADCERRILLTTARQIEHAVGSERRQGGELLIDRLVAAAEADAQAGDFASARRLAQIAAGVAEVVGSPRRGEIDAGIKRLRTREELASKIPDLVTKLRNSPDSEAAWRELVRLCVVELDSPSEVAKYKDLIPDLQVRWRVEQANKSVSDLPEDDLLDLGEWYWHLAEEASDIGRISMLRRARLYYSGYLRRHQTDDLAGTAAKVRLQAVEKALEQADVAALRHAASFFGVGSVGARTAVYVVDRSGSMTDSIKFVKWELKRSIGELNKGQKFHVIFYSSGPPLEMPTRRLVSATDRNKEMAFEFIDNIIAEGQTDPSKALERAFACRPELIYLLTDGEFDKANVGLVKRLNAASKVKVHTIGFLYRIGEVVLKRIADENGGNYKFVSERDLEDLVR
ncbi:MAG: VWA domain-containing protein [Phycisphaerae bacterium]